jgi:preprotein translocase subunit SecG
MSKKNKRRASRLSSSLSAKPTEFNPDYTIIKHDLRTIGILAGIFFAFLIVLAIFQTPIIGLFVK